MRYFREASFRVEPLKVADFKTARDIFSETFKTTPIRDFQMAWSAKENSLGIYTKEGDLVGFILCVMNGCNYDSLHINFIAVHPLYQRYRLGACLLETVLKRECDARHNVTLTPLYTHVWYWYHQRGFYVTRYSKARGGGVFALMNFHHYPTRGNNMHLWFPTLLPIGGESERYVGL